VPVAAYDPIVLKQGWERVRFVESGPCQAEVGTNGRFYVLAVYGMEPGERANLVLTNGEMRPIVRTVIANSDSVWSDYYVPFQWGRSGGTVSATISSQSCDVALGFDWTRFRG
jgi:hypothetical protein